MAATNYDYEKLSVKVRYRPCTAARAANSGAIPHRRISNGNRKLGTGNNTSQSCSHSHNVSIVKFKLHYACTMTMTRVALRRSWRPIITRLV